MTARENDEQAEAATENKIASPEESMSQSVSLSELSEAKWSVVTFEKRAGSGLTYEKAAELLGKLAAEKTAGLCIITDEAAERIKNHDVL